MYYYDYYYYDDLSAERGNWNVADVCCESSSFVDKNYIFE